ncbi:MULTISPECIES: cytochrome c [Ralstonia]|jgi:mono/diheme cytochrome c family protein|uniref:Cytochrome c, mono-and diheme variants family n=2 Tax=Ralstonia TaxID=48736 RepID=R0E180_RALPI|nr:MULTISPECIES: cytochrome c [Ralstonia]MEA3269487.1 cytochrome c [Pseudomonadota bacterium]ENZ75924.1 cytochrome c, mono- and diheme variants family [Ralstonia pickettii OR214]MCM3583035.1 cytochrome c [Ralstonia pickettii]MDR9387257.1 cytochrome c [Ralstonia sp. 11b]OYU21228.1 MAG: cytochrome C [Ralstonia sp. PBBBR1]
MSGPEATVWLNALLGFLQWAQHGVLVLLHTLGLTGEVHGQPAWPWDVRIAGETLLIDLGQARQLGLTLIALMLALVAVVIAVLVRRWRPLSSGVAAGLLVVAPWPSAVVLAPAVPTSFHVSPTAFSVTSITQGTRIYNAACASCHGADGRGEGPLAATLTRWPPTVVGPLLGRHADGELFWHIAHGMQDTQGASTMPAFAGRLGDADIWAVLDAMKVLAASGGVRAGGWPLPVALPALSVRCGDAPSQTLAAWRNGQRVRVVAVDAASRAGIPLEDPRFQTLLITPDGTLPPPTRAFQARCVAAGADAWSVFAAIAGAAPQAFSGTQLLADRNGWLRARGAPGTTWSDADFLCTSAARGTARTTSGLDSLIARMDAEPVRYVKGGFIH